MTVLITGGAGYIGSVIAGNLKKRGHHPVILDSLEGPQKDIRRKFAAPYPFYEGDISDGTVLDSLVEKERIPHAAVHCSALTVVPESVSLPGKYYEENVSKALILFRNLRERGCRRLLLSGSASVYGETDQRKLKENSPPNPGSPYARTKLMQEYLLEDLCGTGEKEGLKGITLRYFNPVGAAEDLSSGQWKEGGSHLIAKLLDHSPEHPFVLTGTDLPTRDGTGLRDYFHVDDLARAHTMILEDFDGILERAGDTYAVMNAGSGTGVTVKEFIEIFEKVSDRKIDFRTAPPRPGDVAGGFACTEKIERLTGWKPRRTLEEAMGSALAWNELAQKR